MLGPKLQYLGFATRVRLGFDSQWVPVFRRWSAQRVGYVNVGLRCAPNGSRGFFFGLRTRLGAASVAQMYSSGWIWHGFVVWLKRALGVWSRVSFEPGEFDFDEIDPCLGFVSAGLKLCHSGNRWRRWWSYPSVVDWWVSLVRCLGRVYIKMFGVVRWIIFSIMLSGTGFSIGLLIGSSLPEIDCLTQRI